MSAIKKSYFHRKSFYFINFIEINFSDESYIKLLVDEGSKVPSDSDPNYEMKLPEWADHDKIKR